MTSIFKIIVAHDKLHGIGKNNEIPWYIPSDFKWFRSVTDGGVVIMGRNTWESIPNKPLKNRDNIVISRQMTKTTVGEIYMPSFETALSVASSLNKNIYVIGGAQIYNLAINHPSCEGLYVTTVNEIHDCDTHFPEYEDKFYCSREVTGVTFDRHEYSISEWSKK